jgi:hypothetical protein
MDNVIGLVIKLFLDGGRIGRKSGEANFSSHRKVKTVLIMKR